MLLHFLMSVVFFLPYLLFLLGIFFIRGYIYLLLFRLNLYANCFGKMPADLVTILLGLGPLWCLSLVWMQFLSLLCTAQGMLPSTFYTFVKKK